MDTIYENESTPKKDGYRMPGEFEPQECIWMLWPHRPDNWRDGAKPARRRSPTWRAASPSSSRSSWA